MAKKGSLVRDAIGRFAREVGKEAADFAKEEARIKLDQKIAEAKVAVQQHEVAKQLVQTDTDGVRWDRERFKLKAKLAALKAARARLNK